MSSDYWNERHRFWSSRQNGGEEVPKDAAG